MQSAAAVLVSYKQALSDCAVKVFRQDQQSAKREARPKDMHWQSHTRTDDCWLCVRLQLVDHEGTHLVRVPDSV